VPMVLLLAEYVIIFLKSCVNSLLGKFF